MKNVKGVPQIYPILYPTCQLRAIFTTYVECARDAKIVVKDPNYSQDYANKMLD